MRGPFTLGDLRRRTPPSLPDCNLGGLGTQIRLRFDPLAPIAALSSTRQNFRLLMLQRIWSPDITRQSIIDSKKCGESHAPVQRGHATGQIFLLSSMASLIDVAFDYQQMFGWGGVPPAGWMRFFRGGPRVYDTTQNFLKNTEPLLTLS